MAPKSNFILKDSPHSVIAAANAKPKGRSYDSRYSNKPGGVKVSELVQGMKYASLAITDDKPNTLRNVSKSNPWQKEAIKLITGSKEEAYKPLTEILKTHFNLTVDAHIDVTGIHRGRPLDTQGYIAHNDQVIVLAYRCTTSALDWITNLSTTTSEWEPEVDIELGHAGYCSCLMGHNLCGTRGDEPVKPRVHTGFYNNFLHTTPLIKKYIEPLLASDQPPRKLFVVGHSLGAGIAQLAASYFLLNFDWELIPQKLICVTAGAPRACLKCMQTVVNERLAELNKMDKAFFCRIVLNEDVVTKVPPNIFGFVHLDRLVYITEEGEILINPDRESAANANADASEMEELSKKDLSATVQEEKKDDDNDDDDDDEDLAKRNEKYEKLIKMVPRPLKDHMPDFYLKPLVRLFEREQEGLTVTSGWVV